MINLEYRVWNGSEMIYDITVGKFGVFYAGINSNDSSSLTPFTTKYPEKTPVMMFTGLLDINGEKMYGKDIIETAEGLIGVIEWCEELACFEIQIHDKGNTYIATVYSTQKDGRNANRKKIGNIYENPELLS